MMLTSVMIMLVNVAVMAQDSASTSSSTTTTSVKTTENWYASPWVWVAGAAVFILLLVALTRGSSNKTTSGSSDRVTVTKTVRRDTDV